MPDISRPAIQVAAPQRWTRHWRAVCAGAAAITLSGPGSLARAAHGDEANQGALYAPPADPAAKAAKPPATIATFIGFRQLGPSRTLIYVELSQPVEATLVQKGRTLEYTLPQTRVTLRNNRRPLLARHFDSAVHSAQLETSGKDVKLIIRLREDADPISRTVRHAHGATFEVELGRPQAAKDDK